MHLDTLQGADVGVRLREQAPAVARRFADPPCEPAGITGLEGALELFDPTPVLGERGAHRLGVLEEDVDPDARVRARDPSHLAERAASGCERFVPVYAHSARLIEDE